MLPKKKKPACGVSADSGPVAGTSTGGHTTQVTSMTFIRLISMTCHFNLSLGLKSEASNFSHVCYLNAHTELRTIIHTKIQYLIKASVWRLITTSVVLYD